MGYTYAILGSGRQGTAAAYDLAVRGNADSVLLGDVDLALAKSAAKRVNHLSGSGLATAAKVDVANPASVLAALKGVDVFVSAVPFWFNLGLAPLAVKAKASMVDLGGLTSIVRKQLAFHRQAGKAGIAIVPQGGDHNVGPERCAVFAQPPAFILKTALGSGDPQFGLRFAALNVFLGIKTGKMLANNFVLAIALQPFGRCAP